MNSVVIKLQGGLGNQMFQYAFGKRISKTTGRKLILDLSLLNRRDLGPDFVYRDFDLDIFDLEETQIVNSFDEEYEFIEEEFITNISLESIENKLKQIESSQSKTIYLEGYWSSPKYFDEIDFTFTKPVLENSFNLLKDIQDSNSVMLNIRRTDFLNSDFHGTYGKDYIIKGIQKLKSQFDNIKFFIFSDDIDWCKENLSDIENSILVTHEHKGFKFANYFLLMINCKHFIIPNSTFAWWAAYLSKNENKQVFYPEIWLKSLNLKCEFLYHNLDWKKINN